MVVLVTLCINQDYPKGWKVIPSILYYMRQHLLRNDLRADPSREKPFVCAHCGFDRCNAIHAYSHSVTSAVVSALPYPRPDPTCVTTLACTCLCMHA